MIAAMTMPTMTHPGTVDWSGENPGMYLKENADGPFSTLVSFFRVVASPHGRGHALILLEAPLLHTSIPEALNVCVTDNESLARYLVNEFAAHFGAFKGAEALQSMDYVKLTGVAASVSFQSSRNNSGGRLSSGRVCADAANVSSMANASFIRI